MDGATINAKTAAPTAGAGMSAAQLPLTFASAGETLKVLKIRGNSELAHHLENLGFVEGALVKVVSGVQGDLVVEVKGAQVAVSRQAANHIITTTAV